MSPTLAGGRSTNTRLLRTRPPTQSTVVRNAPSRRLCVRVCVCGCLSLSQPLVKYACTLNSNTNLGHCTCLRRFATLGCQTHSARSHFQLCRLGNRGPQQTRHFEGTHQHNASGVQVKVSRRWWKQHPNTRMFCFNLSTHLSEEMRVDGTVSTSPNGPTGRVRSPQMNCRCEQARVKRTRTRIKHWTDV